MPYPVILPIFEIKESRFSTVFSVSYLIGFVILMVNKIFLDILLLYFIALGFILFACIIMLFDKKDKAAGLLYLDEFNIKINQSEVIAINEISDLKITIVGFEGKMTGFLKGMDSGNRNTFEFTYKNEKYRFRFFLSYQKMLTLNFISDKLKKNSPQIFRKENNSFLDFILSRFSFKK